MSSSRDWLQLATLLLAMLVLSACGGNTDSAEGGNQPTAPLTPRGWELIWSDEFDGNTLDSSKWNIQTGDGTAQGIPGWGNNELQSYQADNIRLDGGNLVITAREQRAADGRNYTSARINTSGKLDITYGRIEASIEAPLGQGLWSAFWMLPTDSPYGDWAASGEIDIMEVFSRDPTPYTQAVIHYGMAWPLNIYSYKKYDQFDPADGFHSYALEWDQEEIRWFVDGTHFHTISNSTYWSVYKEAETNAHMPGSDSAPFDTPFHLLLNLAVGGNLPGDPVPSALPGEMRVDYVRVYRCNINPASGTGCDGFIDLVDPSVTAPLPENPFHAEYLLYSESAGPIAFPGVEETLPLLIGVWDNNGALGVSEVDSGDDHGVVIDMLTKGGGNMSLYAADSSRQQFFGMGDAADSGDYAGEVQFDLYVYSDGTDLDAGFQVKLDSGFPDLGFVEIPFADVPTDEWTKVTVQISDIAHSENPFAGGPVDLSNVLSLFVLEPTSSAHLRVDNIKILCAHPEERGCGVTPPSPPPPPTNEPFDVYLDSVNPVWDVGINGADSGSGWANYADGTNPANKLQWRELTISDPPRGQVLEVSFTGGAERGVWFIQSSTGVDLSAYADGFVSFDIKVDNYSDDSPGMTMKIDCIFPCTSGDQRIGRVGDGAWETVKIPLAQLLAGGLNINNVNTGLVIFPTDQDTPLTFLLDNLRWIPAETTGPPAGGGELKIFADSVSEDWVLWDCCGGATFAEVEDDAAHGNVVELAFNGAGTVTGFQAQTSVDASGFASGTLEFELKEVSPPPEAAQWRLKLESTDAATAVDIPLTQGGNPEPGATWQQYSYSVSDDLAGLDLANLKLVMVFPDWGNSAGAVARIDNVRFVSPDAGPPAGGGDIEVFADAVSEGWFLWDCCGGATFSEVEDDDADHGKVVELTFNGTGTVTGFQAVSSVDASHLASGTLEFDFKEVSPPPDGSQWRLKLESSNAATAVEVVLTHAGNPMPGGTWQAYRFSVASDLAGLDLANLKLIMVFPDWGNSAGAVARLDNVRLVSGQ